jgi:hypothetical protein
MWYNVFDNKGMIQAYSWTDIPEGGYILKGVLHFYGDTAFIQIDEITKKQPEKLSAETNG